MIQYCVTFISNYLVVISTKSSRNEAESRPWSIQAPEGRRRSIQIRLAWPRWKATISHPGPHPAPPLLDGGRDATRRNLPCDFDGPYLDEYRSDRDETGAVGKLKIVAFQRCQFRCDAIRRKVGWAGIDGPYLDEYRSDRDETGAVGKLKIVALQRCQARGIWIDLRRPSGASTDHGRLTCLWY